MKKDSYDGWIAQDMLFGISVGRVSEFLNEPWQKGDADIQALKHRLEQNELPDPMVYLTFTPFGATLRLQMPGTARHTHWASITPGYEALFSDFRHPLVYLKYKCDDVFRQYMRTVGTRKSHAPDPEENKRLWNDLQDMWVPPEKRMSQPPWEI
jgi:hypothetical protein